MRLGVAVVRGRSMLPTYRDGDRLLVLHGGRVVPGRVHVVDLPPGPHGPRPVAVKRISRRDGRRWWLDSDNPREGVDSWTLGAIEPAAVRARVLLRLPRRSFRDLVHRR
ncbi:S24 family peptidase [Luteipulveratus flavus]|uniref:S24 family peptidase n=1 Tax=Luteipulveratus flavus TaxID=3031728 RepID=A0ABT6C815_9MICO|nr:S24 family peptidase [Luteipulveratus sp. YIM 133296]MDF8265084.1 S24 family peptidase [Luteipulveratus sp. YIM 133296]